MNSITVKFLNCRENAFAFLHVHVHYKVTVWIHVNLFGVLWFIFLIFSYCRVEMKCNVGKMWLTPPNQLHWQVIFKFCKPPLPSCQKELKMCHADGWIEIHFVLGVGRGRLGVNHHLMLAKRWSVLGCLSWIVQSRFNFQVISIEILLTISIHYQVNRQSE